MYDNEFKTKQREIQIKPKIKLNHSKTNKSTAISLDCISREIIVAVTNLEFKMKQVCDDIFEFLKIKCSIAIRVCLL